MNRELRRFAAYEMLSELNYRKERITTLRNRMAKLQAEIDRLEHGPSVTVKVAKKSGRTKRPA